MLLQASTHVLGVHAVTLGLTDSDGQPARRLDTSSRSAPSQVSRLIWVIIGAGVALLFVAIVRPAVPPGRAAVDRRPRLPRDERAARTGAHA